MKKNLHIFMFVVLSIAVASCVPVAEMSTPISDKPADIQGNLDPTPYLSVVYVDTTGNIWLWKDNSERLQLTNSMDAADVCVSTDGKWVAYLTNLGEMWAIKTDGSDNKKLVDRQYLNNLIPFGRRITEIYKFEFIPNEYDIFFQVLAAGDVSGVDLFRVNTDRGLISRVFEPGQGGNGNYFSPDGNWVVIAYPNELVLAAINSPDARHYFQLPPMHGFSSNRGPQAVWLSDSSGFYVVVPEYDHAEYLGQESMYYVSVDANVAEDRQISFMSLPYIQSFVAPDGESLAYLVDDGEVVNLHIVTKNGAGALDEIYISEAGVGFFNWNPDGERFVIWRGDRNKPLIATRDTIPVPLVGDSGQLVDSFQWVANNCFLFTNLNTRELGLYYLLLGDITDPYVKIATNVLPDKYDFTGKCRLP